MQTANANETANPRPCQETKVGTTWDHYWNAVDETRFHGLFERLAKLPKWYRRPFTSGPHDEVRILRTALCSLAGKHTLEIGSGIGWTSLWLSRAGARTTVVDISDTALDLSRRAFALAGCDGAWLRASIFAPDPRLAGQDLVFNSGLIEHFHREDQIRMLASMRNLARPGGHVAVIAPYAGGRLYVWAKQRLEQLGLWRFGDEFPLWTMKDLGREVGLEVVSEVTAKPGDQWNFLSGVKPALAMLGKVAYLATLADWTPLWKHCIGDSLIATVFKRPQP